jgi:hypothetical protein
MNYLKTKSRALHTLRRKFYSSGITSACGVMGREIESRQGICRVVDFKLKKSNYFKAKLQ